MDEIVQVDAIFDLLEEGSEFLVAAIVRGVFKKLLLDSVHQSHHSNLLNIFPSQFFFFILFLASEKKREKRKACCTQLNRRPIPQRIGVPVRMDSSR